MELTLHSEVACPFEAGTSIGIYGPSRAGKSTWIEKLLKYKNVMFTEPPQKILYCYSIWTQRYESLTKDCTFSEGLPSLEDVQKFGNGSHNLLILDDLMSDLCKSNWCDKLFTALSHHLKITVIFVSQNLFPASRIMRNVALNLSYMVLFRSSRDRLQVGIVGSQLGDRKTLLVAYDDATSTNYGYLVIDFTSTCNKLLKFRTNVFPKETVISYA
jgi:hypothetical protein